MSRKKKEKDISDRKPRDEVVCAVAEKAKEGRLSCVEAHSIAERMDVPPPEVGHAADFLDVRISQCQLGLFGYGPGKKKIEPAGEITPPLKKAIESAAVDGRLGCAAAWRIAEELHLPRERVSSACEAMKIKLSACQLGAF